VIQNDLYCPACGATRKNVRFDAAAPPACRCGTPMRQDWSHGHPPATDLHAPRMFQGLDRKFSSTREAERAAKRVGEKWTREMQAAGKDFHWTVDGSSGDKRGGARDVNRLRGVAASYAGQRSRTSTGERSSAR
jgi:hypothetical protein